MHFTNKAALICNSLSLGRGRVTTVGFHLEFSCGAPRPEGPSDGHPGVKWAVCRAPHRPQPELFWLLLVLLTGVLSLVAFERVQRVRGDLRNHRLR